MRPWPWKPLAAALVALNLIAVGRAGRADEPAELRGRSGKPGLFSRFLTRGPSRPPVEPSPISISTPRPSGSSTDPILLPPAGPEPGLTAAPSPRLVPQARVCRPVTESDPILTRIAVERTSDGAQFCEFLQVYADGTALDSQGVHRVDRDVLRPLIDAIQTADAYRLKGHCGGPPTDFVEQVSIVVYDRSLGRLRANAFSYSGNPQGCDPAVRNLQAAIDTFQARLSRSTPADPPARIPTTTPDPTPIPLTPAP